MDVTNYYFWDPSTKEEINLDELGSDSPISIGTIAKRSEEIFTAIPDIIKFEMENNQQKSINYLQGYLLRFSPNKSWLSITAPNDTTITEEDPDLLSDKYGVVKVSSNPQEGSDFYFTDGNNSIEGEHLIKQTSSLVDTTYFTPDKKHYQVRKKTLVELIEKNTWKTPLVPQGAPFEHILKKDSVYQTINVDLDTGVGNEEVLPTEFNLYQNYPNPFNPTTTIKFTIPTSPWRPSPYQGEGMRERLVTLRIYDALGREIKTLINEQFEPGEYELKFDGSDLPSGIYFYKLSYGNQAQTRKMMLLK